MANFNADVWRVIAEKVQETVNAAIAAHEAKAASATFANSHVPTVGG